MTTFLHLKKDEQIIYQLILEPAGSRKRGSCLGMPRIGQTILQAAGKVATISLQTLSPRAEESLEETKGSQNLFKSSLRLFISSSSYKIS